MLAVSKTGKAASALSRIPHMADGGRVSPFSLKGMVGAVADGASAVASKFSKPEGYTAATPAPAPAPAAAPAASVLSNITSYGGTGALQRREAAAGMANGGKVKGKSPSPTADNIPAMLTAGEHVLPVSTVKALGGGKSSAGHKLLDGLVAATHKPSGKPTMKLGKQARRDGGPIGKVDEDGDVVQALSGGGEVKKEDQIPTDGYPAVTVDNRVTGNELTRNASNALNALGGVTAVPAIASKVASSAPVVASAPRAAADFLVGAGGTATRNTQLATRSSLVEQGSQAARTLAQPAATGAGNYGAATARAAAGANAFGDAIQPIDVAAVMQGEESAGAGRGFVNPELPTADPANGAGAGRGFVNPAMPTAQPANAVPANAPLLAGKPGTPLAGAPGVSKFTQNGKTLYSNVAGTTDNDQLMSGKPGVQIAPGAAGPTSGAAQTLAGGSADPALFAARSAAVARGDMDAVKGSYAAQGQTFNDGTGPAKSTNDMVREQLTGQLQQGKQLTRHGAQILADINRSDEERKRDATAAAAHGQDATLKAGQIRLSKQMEDARAAWMGAKTPEEKVAAEETLRVLQGHAEKQYPELFATTALPGSTDALGNKTPGGAIVTDKRSGSTRIIYGQDTQPPKAVPLPAKADLKVGETYQTPRGPGKWDGKNFHPA